MSKIELDGKKTFYLSSLVFFFWSFFTNHLLKRQVPKHYLWQRSTPKPKKAKLLIGGIFGIEIKGVFAGYND